MGNTFKLDHLLMSQFVADGNSRVRNKSWFIRNWFRDHGRIYTYLSYYLYRFTVQNDQNFRKLYHYSAEHIISYDRYLTFLPKLSVDLNKWRGKENYLEGETRISSPITPEFLLQIPFQRILYISTGSSLYLLPGCGFKMNGEVKNNWMEK